MFTALFLLIMGAIASVLVFLAVRDEVRDGFYSRTYGQPKPAQPLSGGDTIRLRDAARKAGVERLEAEELRVRQRANSPANRNPARW